MRAMRYLWGVLSHRKGQWRKNEGEDSYKCSNCQHKEQRPQDYDRCPECGTDMVAITTYHKDYIITADRVAIAKK